MAVFWIGSGDPFHYDMDEQPFYDAVFDTVSSVSSDVFVTLADARRYSQGKSFDFGVWWMRYVLFDSVERVEKEYGEAAGLIVGTIGLAAGWSPLFATTMMAYTNPYTVGPAFALDAYNIYRYFD
jgi:hypothetical protein